MLEVTKSTYFPAFNRLCKEVAQARMEANDNIVYLQPMVRAHSFRTPKTLIIIIIIIIIIIMIMIIMIMIIMIMMIIIMPLSPRAVITT